MEPIPASVGDAYSKQFRRVNFLQLAGGCITGCKTVACGGYVAGQVAWSPASPRDKVFVHLRRSRLEADAVYVLGFSIG